MVVSILGERKELSRALVPEVEVEAVLESKEIKSVLTMHVELAELWKGSYGKLE